ncbi:DUF6300 family protein [Streptomyces malaysiense]|uniref:Uncharacterized protein n=1 Tax=Streptomyces malaysiense TaxID=1428626 RepID=A0A1J4Q4Z4_9ACTN|nr:DUF6300 family protein [Streptomyces malaysiense]OIK28205.1 hypothetical protein VT52_007570 [Streptomyces malaysiense]
MTDPSAGDEAIHLRVGATPPCTRCEGPTVLQVRFPYSWTSGNGNILKGLRESTLCPVCDQERTEAEALSGLLTSRHEPDTAGLAPFVGMVAAWVESLRQERVDLDLLATEHERWQRGDL